MTSDGKNSYAYDAEGRLCAVGYPNGSGGTLYEQYLYDAEGRRVAKGTVYNLSCAAPLGSNNFTLTNQYLLGQGGEQVTELDGVGNWKHSNIAAGSGISATYDSVGLHFPITDPLGTKRVQATISSAGTGLSDLSCRSLPFGNSLGNTRAADCTGSDDASEHHFTGKERDTESGNDYFGARYYGSSMGRFMSPDPSGLYYADPTNPQSLNLYAYVRNNPLRFTDPTGLYCAWEDGTSDDDPSDGGATKKQCNQQGGHWTDEKNPCHGIDGCVATFDWNNPQRDKTPTFDPRLDPQLVGVMGALPSQPTVSSVVDPAQARIAALVQGVANDTKSVKCLQEALGKNGISLGLDAAGFIPGESQAAAGAQLGVAGASYVNSLANKDANGAVTSVIGGQITGVGMAQHSLTGSAGKAIPFVGYLVNGYATLHDLGAAQKDYDACMSRP